MREPSQKCADGVEKKQKTGNENPRGQLRQEMELKKAFASGLKFSERRIAMK